MNRYFIKKEDQMAKRLFKRHSRSSIFREMQIKISMICYFHNIGLKKCLSFQYLVLVTVCGYRCSFQMLMGGKLVQPLWKTFRHLGGKLTRLPPYMLDVFLLLSRPVLHAPHCSVPDPCGVHQEPPS